MSFSREQLEAWGVPWPEPCEDTGGRRFSRCIAFSRHTPHQAVHFLPPSPPERTIATEFAEYIDEDGEEHCEAIAWRTLDDAEWAEALAAYERNKDHTMAFVAGATIITGTFVTESGAVAEGTLGGGRWHWRAITDG